MGNYAHRARRDASEPEVIHALEVCGWGVRKLAQKGIPDLLIFRGDVVKLVEAKTGKAKLRATQDWAAQGIPVVVLRCAEDVFSWHQGRPVKIAKE